MRPNYKKAAWVVCSGLKAACDRKLKECMWWHVSLWLLILLVYTQDAEVRCVYVLVFASVENTIILSEFSMFWWYCQASGGEKCTFTGVQTTSLPTGDVWKNISDSDNSPLSWLQTSLLTAGKCYTSVFPSALIKIAKPQGFPTPAVQTNTAATFWPFGVVYQHGTQNMQIVAPISKGLNQFKTK